MPTLGTRFGLGICLVFAVVGSADAQIREVYVDSSNVIQLDTTDSPSSGQPSYMASPTQSATLTTSASVADGAIPVERQSARTSVLWAIGSIAVLGGVIVVALGVSVMLGAWSRSRLVAKLHVFFGRFA